MKKLLFLFLLIPTLANSQSKPITVDSTMYVRFNVVYGDSILSREDPSVLGPIVRLRQLHAMFNNETDIQNATFDQFMTWIDLRIIRGHSATFTKKYLTERAGLSTPLPPGNR